MRRSPSSSRTFNRGLLARPKAIVACFRPAGREHRAAGFLARVIWLRGCKSRAARPANDKGKHRRGTVSPTARLLRGQL